MLENPLVERRGKQPLPFPENIFGFQFRVKKIYTENPKLKTENGKKRVFD
jgi:hypothetical protein